MARRSPAMPSADDWMKAKSLMPSFNAKECGLQGALVPDSLHNSDHIAVVYNKGDTPPEITVHEVSGCVHKVCANGVAVAVVACSSGPALHAEDVLLVERTV